MKPIQVDVSCPPEREPPEKETFSSRLLIVLETRNEAIKKHLEKLETIAGATSEDLVRLLGIQELFNAKDQVEGPPGAISSHEAPLFAGLENRVREVLEQIIRRLAHLEAAFRENAGRLREI